MPADRQQPEAKKDRPADMVDLVFRAAIMLTLVVTPWTRSRFGSRAFSSGPYAGVLMFFYAGLGNCPELAYYIVPWIVCIAFRRLTADRTEHSTFRGYVWSLTWLLGHNLARLAEAALLFGAAVYLQDISVPLARFVGVVAIALLIVLWGEWATYKARAISRRDAEILARHMNW